MNLELIKNLVLIGKILKPNGYKGVMYASFYLNNEDNFFKYKKFYDKTGRELRINLYSKRANNKKESIGTKQFKFLITIDGVRSQEGANALSGSEIYVMKDDVLAETESQNSSNLENEEGEGFFLSDLIGLKVCLVPENNSDFIETEIIGKVDAIHDFGSCPLIEIVPMPECAKVFDGITMFAFDDANFPKIDIDNGLIYFIMPEISNEKVNEKVMEDA